MIQRAWQLTNEPNQRWNFLSHFEDNNESVDFSHEQDWWTVTSAVEPISCSLKAVLQIAMGRILHHGLIILIEKFSEFDDLLYFLGEIIRAVYNG